MTLEQIFLAALNATPHTAKHATQYARGAFAVLLFRQQGVATFQCVAMRVAALSAYHVAQGNEQRASEWRHLALYYRARFQDWETV